MLTRITASGLVLDDPGGSMANQTQIQQYRADGGPNQQWALFVPNPNASTNSHWSGYAAATSLSQPQANSVSYVSGSWIVPTLTDPASIPTSSSIWVGIDGFHTSTVEQAGTEGVVNNGVPYYRAWWEMWSTGKGQDEQVIPSMTVMPGDSMTASVQYITAGTHAGDYYLSIVDHSRPNDSFSIYASSEEYQSPLATRTSAEWIFEGRPAGSFQHTLPDFGSVTFTSASAVINGVLGGINGPARQSQAVNISINDVTYDTTSVLTHSGSSFALVYTGPLDAGTDHQIGANFDHLN